jgi:hypothetical protein
MLLKETGSIQVLKPSLKRLIARLGSAAPPKN